MDNQMMMVQSYLSQDYKIESQSDTVCVLVKKKKFLWWLFILSILFFALPAIVYIVVYLFQKDKRIQIHDGIVSKIE